MSSLQDPIRDGLRRGWKVLGGPHGEVPPRIACDVAIIGSGAGAGITAELLAKAGLKVVIVEEGPLKSSSDFNQQEATAYPSLYQESAARKTEDKAINILQGRCVGGSTTVNWTSSFRTPVPTLNYWREHFGLAGFDNDALAPYFAQAERRLNIVPWLTPPNENNDLLRRGAAKLGISAAAIARNVKGCWNLGSCGLGCPTNAKQSMLVTTIPAALDLGAILLVETRAERLSYRQRKDQLAAVRAGQGQRRRGGRRHRRAARSLLGTTCLPPGRSIRPQLLLRSEAPDPHGRLGVRTFLHPVVISAGVMEQKVEGWQGAPQSIYTDHFLETNAIDGPIGFKLEAPPLHPVIFASSTTGFGREQAELLKKFPNTHVLLALLRDGFHRDSPGGKVKLRGDGSPVLDYPLTDFVMAGARRAMLAMAEIQFAAGALQVLPVHELARPYASWKAGQAGNRSVPHETTAHQGRQRSRHGWMRRCGKRAPWRDET